MKNNSIVGQGNEAIIQTLQALYRRHGYTQYKMNKFETYDFYVRNKDFLVSDRIISFTDTDGRLMALKPDVTLSIAKSYREEGDSIQKLYYNESVYRTIKANSGFQEIIQTGLECLGNVELLNICEVLMLAAESMSQLSDDYLLDISHMGYLTALLDELDLDTGSKNRLLALISEKNSGELAALCTEYQLSAAASESLVSLADLYGSCDSVLERLEQISLNAKMDEAVAELRQISQVLQTLGYGQHIKLDFSLVSDMNYYTGVLFQGFIAGIPEGVLSGGQYDKLMAKLGKKGRRYWFCCLP